jgi:hypothetical protein
MKWQNFAGIRAVSADAHFTVKPQLARNESIFARNGLSLAYLQASDHDESIALPQKRESARTEVAKR